MFCPFITAGLFARDNPPKGIGLHEEEPVHPVPCGGVSETNDGCALWDKVAHACSFSAASRREDK